MSTATPKAQAASTSDAKTASRDLDAARQALGTEADGLRALRDALSGPLGTSFIAALDILSSTTGRIIVTGMGKSGHVGRKIASTLASTGTAAFFVHPGEASHGDLGMVTPGDAVIALSNSGATDELSDIVAYAKLRNIPLIAITSRAPSALADAANVALVMPNSPEACPMGLAPTTSTTAMMALGDAMAVAMLERKGFSEENFQVLHPGGRLGQRFLRVAELMHSGDGMPLVAPDMKMSAAVLVMSERRLGCVGVVDAAGKLVGIVTDGDLRRHMTSDLLDKRADQVMTPNPKTIRRTALVAEAVGMMTNAQRPFTMLWVVETGRPVGILHIHDCLRAGVA